MNREIATLREVVTKLTQMLAGMGVRVTQQGVTAYVETDKITLKPIRVNIPMIPDNASESLIMAIQGFIDHECAHILFTDFRVQRESVKIAQSEPRAKGLPMLWNIFEDTFIERAILKKFPGSAYNLEKMHHFFVDHITKPALAKLGPEPTEKELFNYLLVPAARAWSGQKVFQEFMKDHWASIQPVIDKLDPAVIEKIAKIANSGDSLDMARAFNTAMNKAFAPPPPPPPAPPACSPPPEESDEGEGSGEGDSGERDDSEKDETPPSAPSEEPGTEPAKDKEPETEKDKEPESAKDEEPETEKEEGEAPPVKDEPAEEPADEGAGDESEEEDEVEPEEPADEGEGAGESEAEEEEDPGESAGESDDEEDADEPTEGAAGAASEEEDDEEGDDAGESGKAAGEPPEGEETGEEEDGAGEGSGEAGAGDDSAKPAEEEEDGDGGMGSTDWHEELENAGLKSVDFDDAIAERIGEEAAASSESAEYLIFTKDADRIEPFPVTGHFNDKWLVDLDDKTRHAVSTMQKEIERMMAARSQVVHVPGFRSGRLHGPSLHRVAAGDDRVFRRKQENRSKDVTVSLLVDCSGSMRGTKFELAMEAGYALSQTLERVGISHEVIGFTTKGDWCEVPGVSREVVEAAEEKIGRGYSRYEALYMPIFKGFDERLRPEVKRRFAAAPQRPFLRNNVDGECVEIAAQRLLQRRERRKVLIPLSDGNPSCATHYPADINKHLKQAVKWCASVGVETIGIGIMDNSVREFYPKHIVLNRAQDLPGQVMRELRAILA